MRMFHLQVKNLILLLILHSIRVEAFSCYTFSSSKRSLLSLSSSSSQTSEYEDVKSYKTYNRKYFLKQLISLMRIVPTISILNPNIVLASNMPKDNGADLSKSQSIDALIPIVQMESTLSLARNTLLSYGKDPNNIRNNDLNSSVEPLKYPQYSSTQMNEIINILYKQLSSSTIPLGYNNEKAFKKIFDEYSDPVSYKQKFMDQNAFLVYYTKGFDGPNRPSMEDKNDIPKQTLQYGYRNDAWIALNDQFWEELTFSLSESKSKKESIYVSNVEDLLIPLDRAILALNQYLDLVPKDDLDNAKNLIIANH